jgi:PAS domain S-box-containing protein
LVGHATVSTGSDSQAGFTLLSDRPVIVEDLRAETRFSGPPLLHEHGVISGMSCIIMGDDGPWGVLGAHAKAQRTFTEDDVAFLQAIANVLASSIQNQRAQQGAAHLAAIVQHSDDAIFSIDLDAVIRSWNRGAERLFGYTAHEVIGQPIDLLIPEDRDDEEPAILNRIRAGEAIESYETLRRRKDGTSLDISLTVSPIKDVSGNVIGASKVARDITDKVRARETLERTVADRTAQLRDTVAELEAFSYSVAHDMRAPLRAMNSYSRFLQDDFASLLPPEGKDFTRRIAASAQRLDALITDVLNYSKIARAEMPLEKVDVEKLTREIVDSYPQMRESGASILVESGIPPVVGNTAALTQCISNLLSNAIKFVAPGKKPRVLVRAEKDGGVVRLWFEDNGVGISEEGRQRIFRLFQRLHPAKDFEGTGIRLTIVRKAVERMGGGVGVESQPGAGSQFWIELEAAE